MKQICMMMMIMVVLFLVEFVMGRLDSDALLELKKGIERDPSGEVLDSWDSKSLGADGCPKDWYGIGCDEGRVVSITLVDTGLVGVFDFSVISELKMLRNLSVSNNRLSGTISKEVGLLESLEYLDLSQNVFSGAIPSQLTDLRKLVVLNLSSNNLGGVVFSGFAMMEQLQYLDLHSNQFSGDLMRVVGELGSAVMYVDLSSNNFTGELDVGIGVSSFVSSVRYMNISHNGLSGALFPHDGMPFFDNLEMFDASDNRFTGDIPGFSFVVSLRVLRLGRNQLSGSLPEALLQESSTVLTELDISHNQLEGPVGSISSMTLRYLNLSFNRLSGPLPAKIGHCSVIDLSNNMLSGNVSRVQSWGNYVEFIDVSSNSLVGVLPDRTSEFSRLASLRISNNSLEGVLPSVLSTYPELKVIDFSLNQLTGSLLPSFFSSKRLTDMNMSYNGFKGTIPIDGIPTQNLSLTSLDLSHNELTGQLPLELGRFQNMIYLDLSHNHFEGGIPSDLPKELKGFNVSYNNLSGTVPLDLKRFPDSAFLPGNSFLSAPREWSSPQGNLSGAREQRGSHMNSVIRAALIAGVVAGALMVAVAVFFICYRSHKVEHEKDQSCLPKAASGHVPGGTSSKAQTVENPGISEQAMKDEVKSSPVSTTSSANASPSNNQNLSENPSSLKVYSPDKLAGDLHLFDSSLRFSAEDLSSAPAEVVGSSCHGTLYKAVIGPGHLLAVKWLKEGIAKGKNEFAREARKLGNIRHPNLVTLRGFYWGPKDHEKLIISDYIDAASLALYLHDAGARKVRPLALSERLRIATDVARCLNYLHSERSIPHGNLKSTNILVKSHSLEALLTDYSLHRIMTSAGTTEQVLVAGALGYRPPEFATTSKPCPSLKSDVYAFGVIFLELLTGRNPEEMILVNSSMLDLTEWVRLLAAENRSVESFDQQILDSENTQRIHDSLGTMLQIAIRCILPASERPDMKMVAEDLAKTVLDRAPER